ncbi:uncharacterized protein [Typha angustifolia]|uniref:uncharacterized protein n=1 Tax=Typha angustifolia TaxID=59011 RepID=UPI003C2EE5F1
MAEERSRPLIIAMKGHPGTGKSTLAHAIAAALRLPLLDKDDVRDCTFALQEPPVLVPPHLLNDLSYAILWRSAATQLRLGLSVVVDSPLSRRSHLDALLQLGSRVVVVECRPGDDGEWRRRLEERGRMSMAAAAAEGGEGWHKPANWEELSRLVEGYRGCTDYETGDVKRIVVDTTEAGVGLEEMAARVVELVRSAMDSASEVSDFVAKEDDKFV